MRKFTASSAKAIQWGPAEYADEGETIAVGFELGYELEIKLEEDKTWSWCTRLTARKPAARRRSRRPRTRRQRRRRQRRRRRRWPRRRR
jgi:hypothetical protein